MDEPKNKEEADPIPEPYDDEGSSGLVSEGSYDWVSWRERGREYNDED